MPICLADLKYQIARHYPVTEMMDATQDQDYCIGIRCYSIIVMHFTAFTLVSESALT